jgi:Tripartite tricarboxylate transporter TctB family
MRSSEELGAEGASASDGPGSAGTVAPPSARQDFIGGVIAVAFGAFMLDKALDYPMGSMLRMGPGFFPAVISALIIMLGGALALRALRPRPTVTSVEIRFRPVIIISLAVVVFALMIERFGIVPATMTLVLVSSLAGARLRAWRALIMAAATTAAIYAIFIVILQMPFTVARW